MPFGKKKRTSAIARLNKSTGRLRNALREKPLKAPKGRKALRPSGHRDMKKHVQGSSTWR